MAKSSQGTIVSVSAVTPATTYTPVNCTVGVNMEDAEATDIDITCLSSTSKEYLVGLQDAGTLTLDLNVEFGDAGYKILKEAKKNGTKIGFEIELAKDGTETKGRLFTFNGFVKSLPWAATVDAAITGSANVKISGIVTETDPVTP